MTKKLLALILTLALLLALAACGAGTAPTETQSEIPEVTEATEPVEATEGLALRQPQEVQWPEFGPREDVEAPADAAIAISGSDTIRTEPVRGSDAGPLDQTRPYYGMGTCTTLTNSPHLLYLFVSDNESSWTEAEAVNFLNTCLSPAAWWLEEEAARWGQHLDFGGTYYLCDGRGFCHYDGILRDIDSGCNSDILEKVALSMGFESKEQLYAMTQQWIGLEEIIFVIVPNKPGRSYAFMDGVNDGDEYMEHCVIFGQDKYADGGVYAACPATAAHEILHCFGAEDFYIQDSSRRSMAEAYFPNDIMLVIYMDDIRYNAVTPYTAYTVGWTDNTPDVCYSGDWWN